MAERFANRQELLVARKQVIDERKGRRWNTTSEGRQRNVDLIEQTIEDDSVPILYRLMAAKIHLGIEAQNQADERLEIMAESAGSGSGNAEPQVILVLPSNGSELGHAAAAEENVDAEDAHVDLEGDDRQLVD